MFVASGTIYVLKMFNWKLKWHNKIPSHDVYIEIHYTCFPYEFKESNCDQIVQKKRKKKLAT